MGLSTELRRALNPTLLFEQAFGPADAWQQDVLLSSASRLLLNMSRQAGKSTVAATLAYHQAAYVPKSLVLLLAPTQRQAMEDLHKVMALHRTVGNTVPAEAETKMRLELANGSRIMALPGSDRSVRGYSAVSLLVVDEAARVPDDLYEGLKPMRAVSQGRLIALSTPYGRRGWFFENWQQGEGWERYKVTAYECPRIDRQFLEEERRSSSSWSFDQEYLCIFRETESRVFSDAEIAGLFKPGVETWNL